MEDLSRSIKDIVDEIINNKNLMVNMIDLKVFDNYTFYHSTNVAVLSIILGVAMGMNRDDLYKLGYGALLHDIGKVFIDKEIVNKKGKLTSEEFEQMKNHPMLGYKYVKSNFPDVPIHSYVSIIDHHEKYDGTGYPENKKADKISLFGRIISVADVYDALTSDRPYRKAMLPSEAMEYIMGSCGTLFDPQIASMFTRKIAPYPIGTCVKLSNGLTGIVIENSDTCCLRPKIRVFIKDNQPVSPYEINLRDDYSYMNVTIIDIARV